MAGPIKIMRSVPSTVTETIVQGGLPTVASAVITTAPLVTLVASTYSSDNTESGSVAIAKMFTLLRCTLDGPGRVRLYRTAATRDADLTRLNIPPSAGTDHGIIADFFLDAVYWALDWWADPPVVGYNGDDFQTTTIYYNVTNTSGSTRAVSATLTYVPMEE